MTTLFDFNSGARLAAPVTPADWPVNYWWHWAFFTIALIVAGVVLRWAAIATLRRYFTVDVAIRSDHRVVSPGLYGIVRHPMYLGSFLSFVGLGIAFMNWLSVVVIATVTALAFAYRISVEERALVTALGDDYRAYAARTKRLIPGVF